jgi:hypothetical protein
LISPEKAADLRVKQLEMLQGLVNRMAGYGASFKSYCITVVTAVIGFAFTLHSPLVAGLAILPVIFFALADAQYLKVERRFRDIFNTVRKAGWDEMPSFDLNPRNGPAQSLPAALLSWSIVYFYAPLALVVLAVAVGAWVYGR